MNCNFIYKWLLFTIMFTLIHTQQTSFSINLDPLEEECLMEYFPDKTLVIYEIYCDNFTKLEIVIKDPEQNVVIHSNSNNFKHPFTTYNGGYYSVCIGNTENIVVPILFVLKYGVAAKDYSSVARTKDLKPVDLSLEQLIDRTKDISHYASFSQSHEKLFEHLLDGIKGKIAWYSIMLIVVMILIGAVETIYLKKFMTRRKII